MNGASVWTARRVRKRILCGRTSHGRYVCGGVLAQVIQGFRSKADGSSTDDPATMLDLSTLGVVALPEGFVEDPPGSPFWRPSSRPNRQRRELASWGSPPGPRSQAVELRSPVGCPSATEAQGLLEETTNVRVVCAAS
jgi:hypothetical protein